MNTPSGPKIDQEIEQERAHHDRCVAALGSERDRLAASIDSAVNDGAPDSIAAARILSDRALDIRESRPPHFFGRLFLDDKTSLHIGRLGVHELGEVLVSDWRAPAASAYYRATAVDRLGVDRRRNYSFDGLGNPSGFADEDLEGGSSGGVPDPLLVAMRANRSGRMQEIAQTIQAEQDAIIREPSDSSVLVEGGPGTGKTAVGLHRAAFIAYEWRTSDSVSLTGRAGVLVLGPSDEFIDYINDVLPSLGERQITYRSYARLARHLEGSASPLKVRRACEPLLNAGVAELIATYLNEKVLDVPCVPLTLNAGARRVTIDPDELKTLRISSVAARGSLHQRRRIFRDKVKNIANARSASSVEWPADARRSLNQLFPSVSAKTLFRWLVSGDKRLWDTEFARQRFGKNDVERVRASADELGYEHAVVWDEIDCLVRKPAEMYDHIVADEIQDLSPMEMRMIARRRASRGSLTLLGDRAQQTEAVGCWDELEELSGVSLEKRELTTGYRVPGTVMDFANHILDVTNVPGKRTRSLVRGDGELGIFRSVEAWERDHAATPNGSLQCCLLGGGLQAAERKTIEHAGRAAGFESVIDAIASKGMEYDVVLYADRFDELDTPARVAEAFVACTRAVKRLDIVVFGQVPDWLGKLGQINWR